MIEQIDQDHPDHGVRYTENYDRIFRVGEEIKGLPHDAPGALRAKAALAFSWYDGQEEIAADVGSEFWDTATRADLTRAAALSLCPDYVEALSAVRETGAQAVAA